MITHRFLRAAIRVSIAVAGLGLVSLAGTASADTPASWPPDPPVTALDWVVVLVLIPLGISAVITALVMVTNRGNSFQPGEAWQGKDEWFGGPGKPGTGGGDPDSTGGAGAQF